MVSLDDAVVARLKTHGETFEILVDPNLAMDYKNGKEVDFKELMAIDQIFRDSSSGERASEQLMKKIFGTTDPEGIAREILDKGDINLTVEQRRQMIEDKKKQIVAIIAKNAINPQTNTPHPPHRIEKAMEEARVNIDPFKSAKEQVDNILKKLQPVMPIKFDYIKIAIKIPTQYSGSCYNILHDFGEIKNEEWTKEGFLCLIEIPAGLQDKFYDKINSLTHGNAEIKVLK